MSYQRAVEILEQLALDIAGLMDQAEKADQKDNDEQKLPDEIARREKLVKKMDGAIEELKRRAAKQEGKASEQHKKNY